MGWIEPSRTIERHLAVQGQQTISTLLIAMASNLKGKIHIVLLLVVVAPPRDVQSASPGLLPTADKDCRARVFPSYEEDDTG